MKIYLDTNIYYYRYCPTEKSKLVDQIFSIINPKLQAISNEIMISEMFRALKKQVNLGIIQIENASLAIDYFLTDIGELIQDKKLNLVSTSREQILKTRSLIFNQNLYAVDSIHAVSALEKECIAFITMDTDFKARLGKMKILNPLSSDFKSNIEKIS